MITRTLELLRNIRDKGFFHLLSANVAVGFFQFGSQVVVAKLLTPIELGQIKTMQSFVAVASVIAGFGFNTAVLKLCSEWRSMEERASIFKSNARFTFVSVVATTVGLIALSRLGILSPDTHVNRWLSIYAILIPAAVYTALAISFLQANKRIRQVARLQMLIRVIGLLLLLAGTYLFKLEGFIVSSLIVNYVGLGIVLIQVNFSLGINVKQVEIFQRSFSLAVWAVCGNALSTLAGYMDIFMINYLVEDREGLGYYSLATIFILGLSYITITVQAIATPYFSEKSSNRAEYTRVLVKYQRLMVVLSLAVSIVSLLIVPIFIRVVYGPRYDTAGFYFRLLVPKFFFWSCFSLLGVAMLGLGEAKYNFLSILVTVVVSSLLNFFLLRMVGIRGAAISQTIAYLLTLVVMVITTKHVVKNHTFDGESGCSSL